MKLYMKHTLLNVLGGVFVLLAIVGISLPTTPAFAEADTSKITIEYSLYNSPANPKPHSINLCVNGTWYPAVSTGGKTSFSVPSGQQEVRLFANADTSKECTNTDIRFGEFYIETLTLKSGAEYNFGLSGEPVVAKATQSHKIEVVSVYGHPNATKLKVVQGDKNLCIDGEAAATNEDGFYVVEPGTLSLSVQSKKGTCYEETTTIHADAHTVTDLAISSHNNYSKACTVGVEIYLDEYTKVDEVIVKTPHVIPTAPVPTELFVAAQTTPLPRTGGVEAMVILPLIGLAGFATVTLRRKQMNIS
jgi:hypothetical protein